MEPMAKSPLLPCVVCIAEKIVLVNNIGTTTKAVSKTDF